MTTSDRLLASTRQPSAVSIVRPSSGQQSVTHKESVSPYKHSRSGWRQIVFLRRKYFCFYYYLTASICCDDIPVHQQ